MEPRSNPQYDPSSFYNDPASFMSMLHPSFPIPTLASPDDVRSEAKRRSASILATHKLLRAILERHEDTIQKRWSKKSKAQRLAILLTAWPNMPTGHRPDFEAFQKESHQGRARGTKYRDAYVWPHINQYDLLSRAQAVLLLLNARGRHPPCDFAAADGNAMHLGFVTTALVPIFLNEHVMILNGATNPLEYGKLLAWDDHPDAFEWMHTRKQFLPGEGLLILESQERLLDFLLNCSKQILHEIPQGTLTSHSFPIKPEPQLKTEAEKIGFDTLAIMAAEAPYRVPAHLDFARIESLLAARASAAEDHLWALREDPGYFADALKELKDHRQEMLKDSDGKAHPVFTKNRENIFWSRVVGEMLTDAHLLLEIFSELQLQVHELRALQAKHAAVISPMENLPNEYLRAILRFRHHLSQAVKGILSMLKRSTTASPPLRHLFVRQPPMDPASSKMVIVCKPGIKADKVENELLRLLRILWEDDRQLFLAGLSLVVDELEHLLGVEPKAKELVSPYIAGVIGDLSIISQCLWQINSYQPWANGFETAMVDFEESLKKEYATSTTSWAGMLSAFSEKNVSPLVRLADCSGGRFAYPVEKRQTKTNVLTLRQSEANLDAFWVRVDQLMHAKAGNLEDTATRRLLSQARILQRTLEWVEPAKDEEPLVALDVDLDSLNKPFSALYFHLPPSKSEKHDPSLSLPKKKTKTRGAPQPSTLSTEADCLEAPNPEEPQMTISVDARALKVFRTIFFTASPSSTPGEVPWNDFLHALISVNFAAEKLYGSVWLFRPTSLDVNRSIQFHEPHPHGKIPFRISRRHGRRLNRAYGWHGGMFVLKEK